MVESGYQPQLAYRANEWTQRNREAFLSGYTEAAGHDPREHAVPLRAFEADKAARSDDTQRFKAVLDAKMSATQQVMAEQNKPSDPHSKFD